MAPKPGTIEHARKVRAKRAAALKQLEGGYSSLREAIANPPGYFLGVDIWVLLQAPPGMGPASARLVCERSDVWPHTEMMSLTVDQRLRLLEQLPERIR